MKLEAIGALECGPVAMDANGNLRAINNQELPTESEIQAKIAELQAAEPLRQLREQRTRILQESDWMANSDVTMSDAWRTYRQALRDLPANSPNVALDEQGNLINVTWPTKPE
jgi:hypothetical protein